MGDPAWNRTGYIAVPLHIKPDVVGTFLEDLNAALRTWYLEKLDQTRVMHQKYSEPKHPDASVERVREYLDGQMRTWGARQPLPFLHDVWNLPAGWAGTDDAKLVQHARQGAAFSAQGNTYRGMILSGFSFLSHVYGLRFVWELLPAVFEALRAHTSGDPLHLTGLPHLIIKPPRTGTMLAAHVDGGSLKTMLDRCHDVLRATDPTERTVDAWVRQFGFQSLVHIVGSSGHTSILGPMTVARYALVLSMIQNPFNEATLPESDDDWLRHPDMETCFDLGRGGTVKGLSVIVDAFVSKLSPGGKRKSAETSASAARKLITADAVERVIAALRTLYGLEEDPDADAKIHDFRTACRAHIGDARAEAAAEVAPPGSARSAMYVVRKYLAEDLDANCSWSAETPPNFCDVMYNPKCIAVLNRVMRAVVTGRTASEVDRAWIRAWQGTEIGVRATAVLRGESHDEMGVIPITTGSADHLPYVALWPDGFIHGSNATQSGPRVSITVPIATASRLDEPWAGGAETHRERIERGIRRVDDLAEGDFDAIRKDKAVYATGNTHLQPHREADDAGAFAGLYVTREQWADLKAKIEASGILPAARGDRVKLLL
jgi:hypothetical protein